jgi:hypothetical protein
LQAEQCHSCAGIPPFAHSDRRSGRPRPRQTEPVCFAGPCRSDPAARAPRPKKSSRTSSTHASANSTNWSQNKRPRPLALLSTSSAISP